ncbi:hypothetical protein PLESTB_000698500 [Pleodorina starrii]|uniref:Solute carrier family 40 member n=1 Tax=Pleodorina starrii TaxID=330485 RepID=A0A9W6F2A7_9CHLO|nr:hypothetical protein PLESTM_001218300 [Pleodorina starrii]GLC53011.1 hypothetical protein PLESTB_000698500 [Pleodorina starrii]GLC65307.1 hypothetical protein PLESTF_000274800 [Pleodorina starrii]
MSGPRDDAVLGTQEGAHIPARAKFFLCASYALAAWAWRSWEFIVALVLIELYPESLLMVSAYGLLDNLARVLLGPVVGNYVDRHERLPGAQAMLRLQNLCIGGSAAAALVLLWPGSTAARLKASYWALMWLLTALGACSSAGSTGVSIAVEREAVKALCGPDGRALARLNSLMRAIDLSALLCAPLAAGLLMTATGPFTAVAAMAGYCGAAYVPEVLLLGAAFRAAPVLGQPKIRTAAAADHADAANEHTGLLAEYENGTDGGGAAAEPATPGCSPSSKPLHGGGGGGGDSFGSAAGGDKSSTAGSMEALEVVAVAAKGGGGGGSGGGGGDGGGIATRLRAARRAAARHAAAYADSWIVFWRQRVLLLCCALALLYMTVLSLGFLMTSFLKWSGLTEAEVSGYRGIGALTGLAATALFPPLSARAGLLFCAVAGVTYQLACLAAGVLPVAVEVMAAAGSGGGGRPSTTQVRILVAGLVSSRTGLWLYDLAVTQLIQEEVGQDQLGSVYGVQSSLQAVCEMLSFVAGLVSPDPARFHWLMLGSLGAVASAAALVWCHACCTGRGGRIPVTATEGDGTAA